MISGGMFRRSWRSVGAWVLATVLTCGAILAAQIELHRRSDRGQVQANAFMTEFGQARNDLYLGFLHLSLGQEPGSPWQRQRGGALLRQSLERFKRTLQLVPAQAEATPELTRELESFTVLAEKAAASPADQAVELELRTALYRLDRLVARVDAEARAAYVQIDNDLHPFYILIEVLSVALLLIVGAGVVWADRRQAMATAALWKSEDRFRRLFDDAPIPMGQVDRDGRMIALNAAFHRTFGYGPHDLRHLDDWWRLAYPDPDYRKEAMSSWQIYIGDPRSAAFAEAAEYRVRCKDGSERVVDISGIVLADGSMLAALVDMTAHSRAEQALIEQAAAARAARAEVEAGKSTLEAALAAMSDAVFIADNQGQLVHVNGAFARFFRCGPSEDGFHALEEYRKQIDVFYADGRPMPVEERAMARALRGETAVDQDYVLRRKDSGLTWNASCNFGPIRGGDGRIVGAVVTGRDVTERKQAEQELRESKERLRLLVEHAPVAIAMFDREMRYLVASRRWVADYRLEGRDIIGHSHYEIFPDLPALLKEAHRRGLAGEIVRSDEDQFQRADGTVQWIRWEVLPWPDRAGEVGGIVIFIDDITARKVAIEELRESHEKLARSQKLEAIGQLTGGVAHDFNNLLAIIMGNVEMLKVALGDRPDYADVIERILRATHRGAELTRRLLAYARQQKLKPESVDLNALIRETVKLFARTLGKNIVIETQLATDVDGAVVDRGQLENALLNLALNARDAMPQGGKLVIATAAADIGDSEAKAYGIDAGSYESISVIDQGEGMPPEVAARAFDPFFTTKETEKAPASG